MHAQWNAGAVALTIVTAAIHQVREGTDRTAAELALFRLQGELTQLLQVEKAVVNGSMPVTEPGLPRDAAALVFFAGLVLLLWSVTTRELETILTASAFSILLMAGGAHMARRERQQRAERLAQVRSRIARVQNQIARNRAIVDV
jgi:hypothetical protein